MFAAPIEGSLKYVMEFGETGCPDHEQSPPHQRTHAAEHYAKGFLSVSVTSSVSGKHSIQQ